MNNRCVVLTPVARTIEPHCELSLRQLEARGYVVRRWFGASAIDLCRSQLATAALADGFDELMWIDDDIAFDPASVDRLRSHGLPIVCGLYPTKVLCKPTWLLPEGADVPRFGEAGGLVELRCAPAGFLFTRREVYQRIQELERLPLCNRSTSVPAVPFFLPMVLAAGGEPWYFGEDFAFSERARRCGFRIFADTTITLQHIGPYGYGVKHMCLESRGETPNK